MNISTDFAPPFKLIVPFFILGIIAYVVSSILLLGFDIQTTHILNNTTLSWAHLFLLGFVMMIILGAMAQLVPVVLEVGHFAVDLYYAIPILLIIGVLLMVFGFYINPILLPFGGTIVLISFAIFIFETFMTITKVKKMNFVILTVLIANIFLLFGLIVGIIMALGFSGLIIVDVYNLLKSHIYLVLFGYVGITAMGMSLVLLPMFWLSHSFSWKYVKVSVAILCVSIILVCFSSIINSNFLEYLGYILSIVALFLYFYQIYVIYDKRVRFEHDIYYKSMIVSFVSLMISLILGTFYILEPSQNIILSASFVGFNGFISFIIIGHLYKIIPFLVWYDRFSPFVGKKKVPMLADMIPNRSANFQFIFSNGGVLLVTISLLFSSDIIFKSGISFLIVGAIFLLKDIFYMINFKG